MSCRSWSKVALTAGALLLAVSSGLAQRVKDTGPKYDVANEVKIKGVVTEVREVPGNSEGIYLVVKTDTGTALVRVAPAAFLKEMDTSFAVGNQVQVTGAKALNVAEEQILAREIIVGTNTVTLRDDKGVPVWVGWNPAR
jgi:DNA/RNA endonuclease YhcR with UshA esterase domain